MQKNIVYAENVVIYASLQENDFWSFELWCQVALSTFYEIFAHKIKYCLLNLPQKVYIKNVAFFASCQENAGGSLLSWFFGFIALMRLHTSFLSAKQWNLL